MKAEKKAKKEAERLAREEAEKIHDVTYLSVDDQDRYPTMGDMARIMSRSRTGRKFVDLSDFTVEEDDEEALYGPGDKVWIRGRLHSIRAKGGSCFIVIRQDSFNTIQAVYFKDKEKPEESAKMMKYLKSLTVESIVDLKGTLTEASVKVRLIVTCLTHVLFYVFSLILRECKLTCNHPSQIITMNVSVVLNPGHRSFTGKDTYRIEGRCRVAVSGRGRGPE